MSKAKSENIYATGTLWSKLIADKREKSKKPEGRDDAYVFFVGDKSSGKTFSRDRLLNPREVPKERASEGLEYKVLRKNAAHGATDKKDVAHIWELAGGEDLGTQMIGSELQFMTMKQLKTGMVVVVVDLSSPHTVVERALFWLGLVTAKLAATYKKMTERKSALPTQLQSRAKQRLFAEDHPDRDVVKHTGISLMLLATKYDAFEEMTQEPEARKVVAKALRFVAHTHGAHLVYVGDLDKAQPSSGPGRANKEAYNNMLKNFRGLAHQMMFVGLDKKLGLKVQTNTDHLGPLFVKAGEDTLRDIGLPKGGALDPAVANGESIKSAASDWSDLVQEVFPVREAADAANGAAADNSGRSKSGRAKSAASQKEKFRTMLVERYPEADIDALFAAKEQELKQWLADQRAMQESKRRALEAKQQEIKRRQAAAAAKKKAAKG